MQNKSKSIKLIEKTSETSTTSNKSTIIQEKQVKNSTEKLLIQNIKKTFVKKSDFY